MTYTEVKEKNGRKYFYRVRSMRDGKKFMKHRIYIGKNLSKEELVIRELKADIKLNPEKKLKALKELIPRIIEVLKKNNVKKAGIFGSYARGEEEKDSDIDILIEPPKGIGFGFAGIEIQLTKALKKKIDLVSYNGLSPYLRDNILNQEIKII
ncbi:MAG: nucleotidyltransferase family protein [Candidatus Pacearchaeota archaeon]|nr:nucleotidyltransferase family protein [Candidatus Pacearchaeota archaeon]